MIAQARRMTDKTTPEFHDQQPADPSRRRFVAGVASAISAVGLASSAKVAAAPSDAAAVKGGVHAIPELAAHWKQLDLRRILSYPAAFVSVSQNKSLYDSWGAQAAENHRQRGSLPATVKVAQAARKAANFKTFAWIGYEVFREKYPQSEFDHVQYASWTKGLESWPEEKKKRDNELVDELRALVQPGDLEFNELALQTAFVGTRLPLDLSRNGIKTIVLTGIHLDWCIEGNARAARDHGYLPIVIGDACACQKPEDEAAAMRRINNFFAPVISSDTFLRLIAPAGAEGAHAQR
jgi:nicotinamidase-related amidase